MDKILFFARLICCVVMLSSIPLLAHANAPYFTDLPQIVPNPNPAVPLAALVYFKADQPVETTLTLSDGRHRWALRYNSPPENGLPVTGMRPHRRHEIRISLRNRHGETVSAPLPLQFQTPPLPEDFPPLQVTVNQPERMEAGVTVFNPRQKSNPDFGMITAVDADGEVVWYYRITRRISDVEHLNNGHFIFLTLDFRVVEIDLLGNTVAQWYAARRPQGALAAIPVDALAIHHEVEILPSGNFMVLDMETRCINDYYSDEFQATTPRQIQNVAGERIVEFIPYSGAVVWRWNAFEHLNPFRIGYGTFDHYWTRRGFPNLQLRDWTHGNSLAYDPRDDSLLLSLRHQSAILKIARRNGEIRWILSEPGGWGELSDKVLKLEGNGRIPYYPHKPELTPQGTLLVFDNGIYRAMPFTPALPPSQTYSRAVEYVIDEQKRTIREIWASEELNRQSVISGAMGDVDLLPDTGNILVSYGAIVSGEGVSQDAAWNILMQSGWWTRIREYTHTTPPELVWEIILKDNGQEKQDSWAMFSAERLPALSPYHVPLTNHTYAP